MITISAVIFLYTTNTRLISVMMISKSDSGDIGAASAIAVMIIIVNLLFKILFKYLVSFIRELKYKNKRKETLEREKKGEKLLENGKEILEKLNEILVGIWNSFGKSKG